MPSSGYPYVDHGAIAPFEIYSILGGALILMPSPEHDNRWLTWGFNPYDPGGDNFASVSDISVEEAVMRIPDRYVGNDDPEDDFAIYLRSAVQVCRSALREAIQNQNVENVTDADKLSDMIEFAKQLANTMSAIYVFNQTEAVKTGDREPITPLFGDRYRLEMHNPPPETMEQEIVPVWRIIDMTKGADDPQRITEEYPDPEHEQAERRTKRLNDINVCEWVQGQLDALYWPEEPASADIEIRDWLIDNGKEWGDPVYQNEVDVAVRELWPDFPWPDAPEGVGPENIPDDMKNGTSGEGFPD